LADAKELDLVVGRCEWEWESLLLGVLLWRGEPSNKVRHKVLERGVFFVDGVEVDWSGSVEVEKKGNDFESMGFRELLERVIDALLL
jgi:hypothetical protein